MIVLPAEPLQRLVSDIFQAEGCSAEEAGRIARNLMSANLTGHDSHGVLRTPRYVLWLRQGQVKPGQTLSIVSETQSFALADGGFGFGQTIAPQSVALGLAKARKEGVAIIAVRNSGHIGRVGDWAEMAAAEGFVSVHFVNVAGSQLVAAFGGVDRRISTAPFTIGFPMAGAEPVILDFATSMVAEGKIMVAASGGKPLPPGVLIDEDGSLSNDPRTLYGDTENAAHRGTRAGTGAIRAMGEHKGSGLALMCELLAGALTASGCAGPGERQIANGMLSFYIDAGGLGLAETMTAEAQRYLDWVKASRPAEPGGEVLLPGEPERRKRAERLRDGIPLPEDGWASICETARAAGIDPAAYGF
jgi:hydroxycarboxylate dehydrogenase B